MKRSFLQYYLTAFSTNSFTFRR